MIAYKSTNSKYWKGILLFLLSVIVSACGGGGGGGSSDSSSPPVPVTLDTMEIQAVDERATLSFTPVTTGPVSTFKWEQTSGPVEGNTKLDEKTLTFIAPNVSENSEVTFLLTISSDSGATASQSLTINVNAFESIHSVAIADASLLDCLLSQVQDDIEMTELICESYDIESLEDLVHFPMLNTIRITNGVLTNVDGISELDNIKILDLSHNEISSFNEILGLVSLSELNMSFNKIATGGALDLSALVNLEKADLQSINSTISYRSPINIEWLEYTPKLNTLKISNNNLNTWERLSDATSLQHLEMSNLYGNHDSLSFLLELNHLRYLDISDNTGVRDLSALNNKINLEYLDISGMPIQDISPLATLTELRELHFDSKNYSSTNIDLEHLSSLTKIEVLDISNRRFTHGEALKNFSQLTDLILSSTDFTETGLLTELNSLQYLDLSYNHRLSDLSGISGLTNLTYLNISESKSLDNIRSVSELLNLRILNMGNLRSSTSDPIDLEPLATLKNLEDLTMLADSVENFSAIQSLENLTILRLRNIEVSSLLVDLSFNTKLNILEIIYLPNDLEIYGIDSLKSLESLTMSQLKGRTSININSIVGLTKLEYLDLSESEIKGNFSDIGVMVGLKHINLSNTNIIDVSSFESLINLSFLDLSRTEIDNINGLMSLVGLKVIDLRFTFTILCNDLDELEENIPGAEMSRPFVCVTASDG